MESFIYNELDQGIAERCGYFEPKADFNLIDWRACWNIKNNITRWTQVIYFPGSFGTFHEGHLSVCKAAMEKYPGAVLVIAPSNSDYTAEKYGPWSEFASNKHRYEAIRKAMPDAVIDLDPMLNFVCDHNFTDQLENFLNAHELTIDYMETKPIILAGKDRHAFLRLNDHTDKVIIEHFEDTTGASSSSLPNPTRRKKNLLLRYCIQEEYDLFCEFFSDQYLKIAPIPLSKETGEARLRAIEHGSTHTICKEYAAFLPYIKLSRSFDNPLEDPTFPDRDERILPGMRILDSDVYSGATRTFILKHGARFTALYNLDHITDEYELLDISDFRKPDFCYPHVDISSRCSMQAFDYDFHKRFNAFKEALSCLK